MHLRMASLSLPRKRFILIGLCVAALSALPLSAQSGHGFNYTDFTSVSGIALNGNAFHNVPGEGTPTLRLTPASSDQRGSAWFTTQQPVADGFTAAFSFQLTAPGSPADGIAFVIQNSSDGTTALGGAGEGMGYGIQPAAEQDGIANSLAVEFDTYQNGFDPNDNHVAVQSCGTDNNTPNHDDEGCALGINSALPVRVSDGNVHTVRVEYTSPGGDPPSNNLAIFLDDAQVLVVSIDLSAQLSLNEGGAWIGLTAATGAAYESHDVLTWSFTPHTVSSVTLPLNPSGGENNYVCGSFNKKLRYPPNTGGNLTITCTPISPCDFLLNRVPGTGSAGPLPNTSCVVYDGTGGNCVIFTAECTPGPTGEGCSLANAADFFTSLASYDTHQTIQNPGFISAPTGTNAWEDIFQSFTQTRTDPTTIGIVKHFSDFVVTSASTVGDVCINGLCTGGPPLDCNDGLFCTDDSCNPLTGCSHTPHDCDDHVACTVDSCNEQAGRCDHTPSNSSCDDNNFCTDDTCNPLTGCSHTPHDCDDHVACTVDSCNEQAGRCDHTPSNSSCDDNNFCTDDACNPLTGCAHTAHDCDDHVTCTVDSCNQQTGTCDHTPNNALCDDANTCSTDTCSPTDGCHHDPNTQSCNDGNACTLSDTCQAGICTGGPPPDCNDLNVCTNDSCNSQLGCVNACNGTCRRNPKNLGYWQRLCRGKCRPEHQGDDDDDPHSHDSDNDFNKLDDDHDDSNGCVGEGLTTKDVDCVNNTCTFANVQSVDDLCDRLVPNPKKDKCEKSEAQLMAVLLNTCRCRLADSDLIENECTAHGDDKHNDPDDTTTVGAARERADRLLCNPSRTSDDCKLGECVAKHINSGEAIEADSLRLSKMTGGKILLTWTPQFSDPDTDSAKKYRVWRRTSSGTSFVMLVETTSLSYTDGSPPAGNTQYEVTPVW